MIKKKIYILTVILIVVLASACGDKEAIHNSNNNIVRVSEEDIDQIKELSLDDIKNTLSDKLNNYIDEYDYLTITSIDFEEDKLLVDAKNEIRKFNNIEMNLDLDVDSENAPIELGEDISNSEKEKEVLEFTSRIDRELINRLSEEKAYEFARINNSNIRYSDNINKLEHSSQVDHIRDDETMIALRSEESEEEKIALKEIFDYIREYKENYELNRFGIEDSILIMEFMDYKLNDKQKIEDLSKELYDKISKNENILQYVDNKAKALRITFINGEPTTFEYEIK